MAKHSDDAATVHSASAEHGHGEIHMPPPSLIPICLAVAMAVTFTGFLISPAVWIPGLVAVVICLGAWLRAALSEYRELPD
jgi:hypothetical protein